MPTTNRPGRRCSQSRIAGATKATSCHDFRHCFATHLLGHKDVNTTMIYTHVLNRGPLLA